MRFISFIKVHAVEFYLATCFLLVVSVLLAPFAVLLWAVFQNILNGWLAIAIALVFLTICIRYVFCHSARFEKPGVLLDSTSQVPIVRVVLSLAEELGIHDPITILIDGSDDFAVSFVTQSFGFGMSLRLRIGFLGLAGLEIDEVRSIIAHELSHVTLNPGFRLWSWTRYFVVKSIGLVNLKGKCKFEKGFRMLNESRFNQDVELKADAIAASHCGSAICAMAQLKIAVSSYVVENRILNRFDPHETSLKLGVVEILKGLQDSQDKSFLNEFLGFDSWMNKHSTHPSTLDRIRFLGIEPELLIGDFMQLTFVFPVMLFGEDVALISERLTEPFEVFLKEYGKSTKTDEQCGAPKSPPVLS